MSKNLAYTHAEVVDNAAGLKDGPIDFYTSKIDGKVDGLSFEALCDASNVSNIDLCTWT